MGRDKPAHGAFASLARHWRGHAAAGRGPERHGRLQLPHNQWWVLHNADGAYEASGIHGQMVHVNPAAEMVIVKLSSHPVASAAATQALTLKAWSALAQAVRR